MKEKDQFASYPSLRERVVLVTGGATGIGAAATFVVTFGLPAILSRPGEVHRMAGGMFTISYTIGVVTPVVCGAFWDLSGLPQLSSFDLRILINGTVSSGDTVNTVVIDRDSLEFHEREGLNSIIDAAGLPMFQEIPYERLDRHRDGERP